MQKDVKRKNAKKIVTGTKCSQRVPNYLNLNLWVLDPTYSPEN